MPRNTERLIKKTTWISGTKSSFVAKATLSILIHSMPVLGLDKPSSRLPEVTTNTGPLTSGVNISQLMKGSIDMLLTDMPLTDQEIQKVRETQGARLIHIATAVTGVVPCYHIPEISTTLRFSSETIAGILNGKILRWNDPAIASINASVKLPAKSILVIGHSNEDGSTYALTDYVSKTNRTWRKSVGTVRSLVTPGLLRGTDYNDIAAQMRKTPYSFSYLEAWASKKTGVMAGSVKNPSGQYIEASPFSLRSAAETASPSTLKDIRESIVASGGRADYPISSLTWVVIPDAIALPEKRSALISFLTWVLKYGQDTPESMLYGRLPQSVINREVAIVNAIH